MILWGQNLLNLPGKTPRDAVAKYQLSLTDLNTLQAQISDRGGVNYFSYLLMNSRTLLELAKCASRDPSCTTHTEAFYVEQSLHFVTKARSLETTLWKGRQNHADVILAELKAFTQATRPEAEPKKIPVAD